MNNILILGFKNIMWYIKNLEKTLWKINTFRSCSNKCVSYELTELDKTVVNNMRIIIVLDLSLLIQVENLIEDKTLVKDIFCLHNKNINHSGINLHNTIKITHILNIINASNPVNIPKVNSTQVKKHPIVQQDITSNSFDNFIKLCLQTENEYKRLKITNIKHISDKVAVYIEFRKYPHSEVIIRNCIHKLGEDWSYTVLTGCKCYAYYLKMCNNIHKHIRVVNVEKVLNVEVSSHNDYNNLLLTKKFWNILTGKKILIYQSDSFIFKNNVSDFLEWDYIGAPFLNNNVLLGEHQVGNGGLSLRSKSTMIEILDKVNLNENVYSKIVNDYKRFKKLDNYPEDIVFSQNMQTMGIGRVAHMVTAKVFAIDTVYCEDSFGMHCMWNGCRDWETKFIKQIERIKSINCEIDTIPQHTKNPSPNTLGTRVNVVTNKHNTTNNIQYDNVVPTDDLYFTKIDDFCKFMNVTKEEVLSNPKQEFRYFCYRYLDYIRNIQLPIITQHNKYESVLIEFRCLPHLEFLIRNCIDKLGQDWSQTIVCGNLNYDYLLNIVNNIGRDIKLIRLDYNNVTQLQYSDMLMTRQFWDLFIGEKILIYQEDTCIFKYNINDFLEWDYIGAPWLLKDNINSKGVGNGGFSLRSKHIMIECLNHQPCNMFLSERVVSYMIECNMNRIPEDVFFTNVMIMHNIGKIACHEIAKHFSSESIINYSSLGGHQFWLNNANWKTYLYTNIVKQIVPTHITLTSLEHRGGWQDVINKLYDFNVYNKNSAIMFYDIVEQHFLWGKTPYNKKWFGIVHCTENAPDYLDMANISQLFNSKSHFLNNIHNCLFLIGLAPNVVDYLNSKFNSLNIKVDVYLLKHPINDDPTIPKFSMQKFKENNNKKIIQIGQQLRNLTSLYLLDIGNNYEKLWLTGTTNFSKLKHLFKCECNRLNIDVNIKDVKMNYTDTFDEYDELISKNIVFIDLFDAAANNTVLECILRRTPIVVNKLPATVYYLGDDYPLFFENITDVSKLLTLENIQSAHNYLKNVKLTSIEEFTSNILSILNTKCQYMYS